MINLTEQEFEERLNKAREGGKWSGLRRASEILMEEDKKYFEQEKDSIAVILRTCSQRINKNA